MRKWESYQDGEIAQALVCFTDINGFAKASQSMSLPQMAAMLKEVAAITTRSIQKAGGRIVKYIGDSALLILPEEDLDCSVRALFTLKTELDQVLLGYNPPMRISFGLAYGKLIFTQLDPFPILDVSGTRSIKRQG